MRKTVHIFLGLLILVICVVLYKNLIEQKYTYSKFNQNNIIDNKNIIDNNNISQINTIENIVQIHNEDKIDDWRLTLVNYENMLPENFDIQLSNIDSTRQFDSRAIGELNEMLKEMKKDGIFNVWVQSSYRSLEYQQELFDEKINTYMNQGKTREEAENLTLQTINKPGTSEHNLGLSVDFNYVDYSFDTTKGFEWLQKNAERYGFILRYKREKENITKINYEPWHWRYVGTENAKKMNELDMCLEEYVEYLKNN